MELPRVAAFTDTYLPTVNGVTYTVQTWRDRWERSGGRMDVVYPDSTHVPAVGEHPVGSVPFPFYEGVRVGAPQVPETVGEVDLVHAHTPFGLGLAGRRLAHSLSVPLVATFHTPTAEYAGYLSPVTAVERLVRETATSYERWFYSLADLVIAPTETAASRVSARLGEGTPVRAVSNGVDLSTFRPVDAAGFRERHGLEGRLVGYTGRHGDEKALEVLIEAAAALEVTVVLAGDGPARERLERLARRHGARARFLGFLDRSVLPAFYSALDVFAFPSPVETQGVVALEAIACGTPVVGVDAGGLRETVVDGVTGYTAPPGEPDAFGEAIQRALCDLRTLEQGCLSRRDSLAVDRSLSRLRELYADLLASRTA